MFLRLFRIGFALIVLAALGVGALGIYGYNAFERAGPLEQDKTLVIARGTGVAGIAKQLRDEGVLREPLVFRAGVELLGRSRDLRAGEYTFPAAISQRAIVDLLSSGKTVMRRVTIPEGLTSREILALVNGVDGLVGEAKDVPPEGSLLPETYHFSYGDDRAALVGRMQADMRAMVTELWENRAEDLPLNTPEEGVVLASIIEKETGVAAERDVVASVFVNRLRQGMKLQSDPTVVFALTEGKAPLGRALTRKDWQVDHPYNTYRIEALPPGPIANPGRAAVEAALNPAETKFIFFVADGSGGHAFAETLKEHNRNVARWRKIKADSE
jgi:UPF0755 protein